MADPPDSERTPSPAPTQSWLTRLTSGHLTLSVVLIVVLAIILTVGDVLAVGVVRHGQLFPRHYYLALGDSLAFGYQPDFNFSDGFADDIFTDLGKAGVTDLVNYACPSESSTTMINGNCPGRLLRHTAYTGPQLAAALDFLHRHAGYVNPITLDLGANDVLPDWDSTTCSANGNGTADLATFDTNLTHTILPQLVAALGTHYRTGDIVLFNYYNPFARQCPTSAPFVHLLNDHLAADAAQFAVPVADVYTAFGGDAHMADHLCANTWICDARFHDIHPTTQGYRIMANAVEQVLSYPGVGPNAQPPMPNQPILGAVHTGVLRRVL